MLRKLIEFWFGNWEMVPKPLRNGIVYLAITSVALIVAAAHLPSSETDGLSNWQEIWQALDAMGSIAAAIATFLAVMHSIEISRRAKSDALDNALAIIRNEQEVRDNAARKMLAFSLSAEITAVIAVMSKRGFKEEFAKIPLLQVAVDESVDPIASDFSGHLGADGNYFPVYSSAAMQLGLLPPPLAERVSIWYTLAIGFQSALTRWPSNDASFEERLAFYEALQPELDALNSTGIKLATDLTRFSA